VKSLQGELPEKLMAEIEGMVKGGWFSSEAEVVRFALLESLRRHRFELLEKFQREDIAWALRQREVKG
jgi:Arc/MetJ-type ribon-helix-helix transcriptional regulator